MFRRAAAIAFAALTLAPLAACSSSSSDAATSTSTTGSAATSTAGTSAASNVSSVTADTAATGGSSSASGGAGAGSGAATVVSYVDPFNADGSLRSGYAVKPGGDGPIACHYVGASAATAGVYNCGPQATPCLNGLVSPAFPDSVLCVDSATSKTLRQVKIQGGFAALADAPKGKSDNPLPVTVKTTDGSVWGIQLGGTGATREDGLTQKEQCYSGPCTAKGGLAILGSPSDAQSMLNKSAAQWTVRVSPESSAKGDVTTMGVTEVWFVKNSSKMGA